MADGNGQLQRIATEGDPYRILPAFGSRQRTGQLASFHMLEDVADDAAAVDERDYTYLVSADCTGEGIGFVHLFDEFRLGSSRRTIRGTLLDDGKSIELPGANLLGSRLAPGGIATGTFGIEMIFHLFIDFVTALVICHPRLRNSSV